MRKDIFKTAFLFMGTLIGAGFASGNEIAVYFLSCGKYFIPAIALSMAVIGILGKMSMDIAFETGIYSYDKFMEKIMGRSISEFVCLMTGAFFFVLFTAMISAFGTMLEDMLGIKRAFGSALFMIFCLYVFINGTGGIVKANCALVPVLILGIILCAVLSFLFGDIEEAELFLKVAGNGEFYVNGVIFALYNIISCVPVIVECAGNIRRKSSMGCILACAALFVLGTLMALSMIISRYNPNWNMPMLEIMKGYGKLPYIFYALSFVAALYTTAAGNGYCAFNWFKAGNNRNIFLKMMIFFVVSYLMSIISFSVFVEKFYFVFAFTGIIEAVFILKFYIKMNFRSF